MGSHASTVELVPEDGTEHTRPFDIRVAHRLGAVELRLGELSGGVALHFALAVCIFNNIAREGRNRGIEITALSVTADGDFDADELSTGIAFSISIGGQATKEALRDLARFGAEDSTIAKTLRHPTKVTLTAIDATAAIEPVA